MLSVTNKPIMLGVYAECHK